jgi:uncharacterized membrane protein
MKSKQKSEIIENQTREPMRLTALSDGLFATVLTLLVLDLRIPDAIASAGGSISSFIAWTAPHLFSYALTFLVAGSYWSAHHRNFQFVIRYDRGLTAYNLIFLFFIGLLPFSTATVTLKSSSIEYFSFSWAIYCANMILAGVMLELSWRYALDHDLVSADLTPERSRSFSVHHYVVPAVFLLSILVEYVSTPKAWGPYSLLIIPLALWIVDRHFERTDSKLHRPTRRSVIWWRLGTILPWVLVFGMAVLGTLYSR